MNKSAYILLVAGIGSAFILLCLLLPEQVTQPMRKGTLGLLGPVLTTSEKPLDFFGQMNGKLKTLDQAQAEVIRLREQVAELTLHNQLLADKATENARLREMIGFRDASQYELLPCRVVSREPSNWWSSVQVNVGDDNNNDLYKKYHGKYSLTQDEPVVSPRGVVGKTGTVSRYATDVILLVDKNCSISGKVVDPNKMNGAQDPDAVQEQGIVQGEGNFEEGDKPRVMVEYLPKNSLISVGQFIVTSGLGPYFPAGLRLGTVVEVPPLENKYPTFGLYRQAIIEPTADLNQLDELFIVLGPKQGTKEADKSDSTTSTDSTSGTTADPTPDSASPDANR